MDVEKELRKDNKTTREILLMVGGILCSVLVMVWAARSNVDRAYLYATLLMLVFILAPFYISFEKDRPYAREVVLVSVMIALAVVGRAAFFWAPQFKPIIAVIIIAGVALGARDGFVVGSMSAFVSNFLFGQGPWTSFQMVAWGLIGFFAGILFYRRRGVQQQGGDGGAQQPSDDGGMEQLGDGSVQQIDNSISKTKSILPIIIYGAVSCFLLHGGITDFWTALSISDRPGPAQFIAVYGAALIPNAILAASTVIFLAALAKPMLRKLERVKTKYGI